MLLIGKPGSGKTSLLKQLLINPQMYNKKFDEVFLVSPSYAKMGLNLPHQNTTGKFSLDWIFDKFDSVNESQQEKIFGHKFGGGGLANDRKTAGGKQKTNTALLGDQRSRFYLADHLKKMNLTDKHAIKGGNTGSLGLVNKKGKQSQGEKAYFDDPELHEKLRNQQMFRDVEEMDQKKRSETHQNILLVLDDVVGQIKKAEFDPRLAQLVMNRRHLILNGTISIIVVSQKYTLIPVRVRSNANWLILFQLNPIDFDNVYKDSIVHDGKTWQSLLQFIFGKNFSGKDSKIDEQQHEEPNQQQQQQQQQQALPPGQQKQEVGTFDDFLKKKKYENLGIWVEFNVYFKNFKRINL